MRLVSFLQHCPLGEEQLAGIGIGAVIIEYGIGAVIFQFGSM